MSLSTYCLEYGRHLVGPHLRRRRRRAYAPTSNTASHDNYEKINSWVSFSFLYGYGAPLSALAAGAPLLKHHSKLHIKNGVHINDQFSSRMLLMRLDVCRPT